MEIPGWAFILVGGIVAAISSIIYFKQGTFQLFIFFGIAFLTYGIYKMVIDKMTKKTDAEMNKDLKQYGKETKLKDLPIGQQLYYQQHYRNQQMQSRQANLQPGPVTEYQQHQAYVRQMQGNAQPTQTPHQHAAQHQAVHPQATVHHHAAQHPAQHSQATHPQAHQSRYAACPRCGAQQLPSNFCMNCGTRMR